MPRAAPATTATASASIWSPTPRAAALSISRTGAQHRRPHIAGRRQPVADGVQRLRGETGHLAANRPEGRQRAPLTRRCAAAPARARDDDHRRRSPPRGSGKPPAEHHTERRFPQDVQCGTCRRRGFVRHENVVQAMMIAADDARELGIETFRDLVIEFKPRDIGILMSSEAVETTRVIRSEPLAAFAMHARSGRDY